MAMFQTSCGQDSCFCSCLFWDLELTKAWLNTARAYLELAKQPRKDVVLKQLLQPCKLTTLQEHEKCFQQWNVMQFWIGIISALVIFVMSLIWFMAEDNELAKPTMSSIFLNALVGILLTVFLTHLSWFGVAQKHGCCCFILCCCLGKPNLLVTAILSAVFGILGLITAVQTIGSAQGALIVVVLIGAACALVHGVALLYVGFEAFMIWKLCAPASSAGSGKIEASKKQLLRRKKLLELLRWSARPQLTSKQPRLRQKCECAHTQGLCACCRLEELAYVIGISWKLHVVLEFFHVQILLCIASVLHQRARTLLTCQMYASPEGTGPESPSCCGCESS